MEDIERRKKQLELGRVSLAKDEMGIRISEREAEIERLKDNIKIQENKIKELQAELGQG